MREDSHSERSELIEDIGQQSSVVDFEIQACLVGQYHDFLKNESDCLDEERIDKGVNDFAMFVSGMFI